MNSVKTIIFTILMLFFLVFSFYPTMFDLSRANHLGDKNREHILEHNYYWPDFNLYLSKIRQGYEGHTLALEKYTSETHSGSLIQEFYLVLGHIGRTIGLDPNFSYQFGRLVLSPLLLFMILMLVRYYFRSFNWQILAFIIIIISGSFPRFYQDSQGIFHIGRYMEWWSNIDSLQRITFIPHILFGQVVSFYLLYQFISLKSPACRTGRLKLPRLLIFVLLGNLTGLAFPPSLITLNGVLILIIFIKIFTLIKRASPRDTILRSEFHAKTSAILSAGDSSPKKFVSKFFRVKEDSCFQRVYPVKNLTFLRGQDPQIKIKNDVFFIIFTLPSLLYIFFLTKQIPWSALVEFHRTHPMMIPFSQYILGTGPIFFLGLAGAIVAIIKKDRKFQPLIFWVLVTFAFAILFTHVKDQSPLRFTQTGLFIPLGILGAYLFYQLFLLSDLSYLGNLSKKTIRVCLTLVLSLYILGNLYMMTVSYDWQTTWLTQRARANTPPVPYPPQAMFPLKNWMDGVRWLRDNTDHNDVVLSEITAGNHIPAYSGNTVYFGQSNTLDYERKQLEVWKFFEGKMTIPEAKDFIGKGRIKYIFYSLQEKEKSGGKNLEIIYPFLKAVYSNPLVTIYNISTLSFLSDPRI